MLAYWWKLIKNFEAVSYKDSYITEDEIVDRALEECARKYISKRILRSCTGFASGFGCMRRHFPIRQSSLKMQGAHLCYQQQRPFLCGGRHAGQGPAPCRYHLRGYGGGHNKPHREIFQKALEVSALARRRSSISGIPSPQTLRERQRRGSRLCCLTERVIRPVRGSL